MKSCSGGSSSRRPVQRLEGLNELKAEGNSLRGEAELLQVESVLDLVLALKARTTEEVVHSLCSQRK